VGEGSVVGQGSAIGARARLGSNVRIQNRSSIVPDGIVEDEVFIGPSVASADDPTMGRHPAEVKARPIKLRRGCRIGAGVVLMPGIEVGEDAVVGAGALVMDDVAPSTVVIGSPARVLRELRSDERLDRFQP
jgi:acetyltransferase-like isoleucine patch superfamily enzyme